MEKFRLEISKMNYIQDKGLDVTHFPICNAIVSTDDWFLIFANMGLNHGQLWRFFFANNTWQEINYSRLPKFFEYVSLFLLSDRYLIVHGTIDSIGTTYRTYMGDLSKSFVRFKVIGTLITERINGVCHHQVVGDSTGRKFLVHGYRICTDHLSVYQLNKKIRTWEPVIKNKKVPLRNIGMMQGNTRNHVLFFDEKLFMFPILHNLYDDFTRMFVFDLRAGKWHVVPTTPDQRVVILRPLPHASPKDGVRVSGYPVARENATYALVPHGPGHAFLTGGLRVSSWESWSLDLYHFTWSLWPMDGPPLPPPEDGRTTATVTPSGRLYVDRAGHGPLRGGRVYAAWMRQPTGVDHVWDALLCRQRHRMFAPGADLSDRALYRNFGIPRRLAVKIRHAATGVYEKIRMFVFDLRAGKWHVVPTTPDQRVVILRPLPHASPKDGVRVSGYPVARENATYALVPHGPGHAFLTGGLRVSSWESWSLDLYHFTWSLWPMDGPPLPPPEDGRTTATVTPSGRLYVDRAGHGPLRGGRVYAAWMRQPTGVDHVWDALLCRQRHRMFAPGADLSDRALYRNFGIPRRLAVKIRHAATGVYESP